MGGPAGVQPSSGADAFPDAQEVANRFQALFNLYSSLETNQK